MKLAGDRDDACDLAQEAMLRAWQSRRTLRDPRAGRVWLFRIVANLWKDQLRRRQIREEVDSERVGRCADRLAIAPDQWAQQREDLVRAIRVMNALPARQRQVLYLHSCESLSVSEIAGVLEISASAVKASLSLARKRVRTQLQDIIDNTPCGTKRTI